MTPTNNKHLSSPKEIAVDIIHCHMRLISRFISCEHENIKERLIIGECKRLSISTVTNIMKSDSLDENKMFWTEVISEIVKLY